jgi:hypothetical protein
MKPELPFLAAGAVAVVGGAIRDKAWPSYTTRAVLGTVALVIVASATSDTRIAPLVRAVGLLLLLTTIMAAVRAAQKK